MKTLIDVDRLIWAKVKEFATIKDVSLNSAVGILLGYGLAELGYKIEKRQGETSKLWQGTSFILTADFVERKNMKIALAEGI